MPDVSDSFSGTAIAAGTMGNDWKFAPDPGATISASFTVTEPHDLFSPSAGATARFVSDSGDLANGRYRY